MDNELKFGDKVYTLCWATATPFGKSCAGEVTFVRETKKSTLLQYEDGSAVFVRVDNRLTPKRKETGFDIVAVWRIPA